MIDGLINTEWKLLMISLKAGSREDESLRELVVFTSIKYMIVLGKHAANQDCMTTNIH